MEKEGDLHRVPIYEPTSFHTLDLQCDVVVRVASRTGGRVLFLWNAIMIWVSPGDTAEAVYKRWHDEHKLHYNGDWRRQSIPPLGGEYVVEEVAATGEPLPPANT